MIDTCFSRVAVDLIGSLQPITNQGNRYILSIVDLATRYPEAVALPRIEAECVAEAMVEVFSRLGVPNEILLDNGTQFVSGNNEGSCSFVGCESVSYYSVPSHAWLMGRANALMER